MLTIIEGADGTGKTTLARKLAGRRATIAHHGPYKGEKKIARYYAETIIDAMEGPIIADRSWISEPIYAFAYRRSSPRVSITERRMLERLAWSVQTVVVYCVSPYDRAHEVFAQRLDAGAEYVETAQQHRVIYDLYADIELTKTNVLRSIHYDWTASNADTIARRIEYARPLPNGGPGVGHYSPGYSTLIVGDAPGKRRKAEPAWAHGFPFVDLFGSGSPSHWLTQQLHDAGIPEADLYWINAYGKDGSETDLGFIEELNPRGIVVLGENAALRFDQEGIKPNAELFHPAYHRRFHASKPYPIGSIIKEIRHGG